MMYMIDKTVETIKLAIFSKQHCGVSLSDYHLSVSRDYVSYMLIVSYVMRREKNGSKDKKSENDIYVCVCACVEREREEEYVVVTR